jgi:hypothetical protein
MQLFHVRTARRPIHASFPWIDLSPALARLVTICVNALRPWSAEDDTLARHECHSWGDSTERQINSDIVAGRYHRF